MTIESLFKSLLEIEHIQNKDPEILCCPGFGPTKESWGGCFNHEVGTFSYCGEDDTLVRRMTFVGAELESFTKSYKREEVSLNHRVRGLSTITLFVCEHHGHWIEKRCFHKGETLVTRMFVELVDHTGTSLDQSNNDAFSMSYNLFEIKEPNYTFIPRKLK